MPETTPTESEVAAPKGEPIAATGWPTTTSPELAERHRHERVRRGVTRSTPTSS